ncbi:PREDICTED: phosphatidylinositol 4-phosphate 3-kinase C2 domain-containing subunit gamma [Dipodomys ordii]|uniref:Phosphatidylinositol 4-phosphate 3-kinase C2 domain-containing subunit gamma n=1 Tax=Dipodomys ordii TaxID=10020 RepID=A0A1S3FVU1_DIPOR|nr:PREDICTED: phosphatidylinositol 4-phosphate 3-kinase C2 domain-containing subunit gamma [Dipodomys ordii]
MACYGHPDGATRDLGESPQPTAHSLRSADHPSVPRKVSLGFDHLVAEMHSTFPLSQGQSQELTFWGSQATECHSLCDTHLNAMSSQPPELPWKWGGVVSPVGLSPSVLPRPDTVNEGRNAWGNSLTGSHPGADWSRFHVPDSPSTPSERRSPREWLEERQGYHIGFERGLSVEDPAFPTDFPPSRGTERSGHRNVLEPSGMFSKGSFLPRGSSQMEDTKPSDCSLEILVVQRVGPASWTSFRDHVEKIREMYRAEDIHSNSGTIWNPTTPFPRQLSSNVRFSVHISTNDPPRVMHLTPPANYLVEDLIAEVLHFFPNDQLFPKDHLLQISGSEDFLQSDHRLGSHQVFQKEKSVIQLHLQRRGAALGKFARQPEDDRHRFHTSQLLEHSPSGTMSRQRLCTALRRFHVQVDRLLHTQHCVKGLTEEVRDICGVLGCIETRQITEAINNLGLVGVAVQRTAENVQPDSETSGKGLIKKRTVELSGAIHQLLDVYCNSFYTDFQLLSAPRSSPPIDPGLHSHLSFTVCAVYNFPQPWVHRITFPLEIKSLPRESMLTVKLFGTVHEHDSRHLLAWTSLPLFPKGSATTWTFSSDHCSLFLGWDSQWNEPELKIDFPETGWRCMKPDLEESSVELEDPPQECLKHIARLSQKQSPLLLSEEKRRYLWFYRFHCNPENCSLPLVLGSTPGWDERTVVEMQIIARRWTFLHPSEALGLLTASFPDQEIRKVAVDQLDRLPNDELQEYLPQLVQAVKFEWSLESPLVDLLLHRSLQSVRLAHRLYWLLKDALHEPYFQSWYQKLLAAFQFCVGKALNEEFSKERKLVHLLGDIAEKVKTASDSQRQEVLEEEIGRLEEFFQDVKTCHLPLNPAWCVKGIDRNKCSYFTSHALPLKISAINTNPTGRSLGIIFKTGDDLRQDMLVLQLAEAMDRMWLQEGLDLRMITYGCLSTGKDQVDCHSLDDELACTANQYPPTMHEHMIRRESEVKALKNFLLSCAGWCVVTFLLGVCDRHNDNIMLTSAGHLFHIDFGKILGHAQTFGGVKRDRAPFIFTSEMEYFITEGGKTPQHFQEFVELCCRAYNIVRRHSRLLLNLLEMMLHAGLPELRGPEDLKYVYDNLRPQDSDLEATSHFTRKIKESLDCFPVKLNNLIHILAQMAAVHPSKSAPHSSPRESWVPKTTRMIRQATILGFSKTHPHHLYLIQVVDADKEIHLTEKSFDQLSKLHSQLEKQFPSITLPEFPHWWHLPFMSSPRKRFRDLNRYLEGITGGSRVVAHSDCVLSFFLSEPVQQTIEESSLVDLSQEPSDKTPRVQLLMSHEDSKLTILVKHMKNVHLPDDSAPSAHVEFYLLPHPRDDRRRKTRSVPRCANPTYNEIIVYDEVTELEGRVLMVIVKSKAVFVGAINIYLCSVPLQEEKWYPLGNSII